MTRSSPDPDPSTRRGRPPAPEAAYRQIAGELQVRIAQGEWAPGTVFPPLRALAKTYGVGYRKIWLAVDQLKKEGLLQGTSGRRLIVGEPHTGGASVLNPVLQVFACGNLRLTARPGIYQDMQRGILKGLGELDAPLLTVHQAILDRQLPTGFGSQRFRGILLMGLFTQRILRMYEKLAVPTVLIDYPHPAWKGLAVSVDNTGAMADATRRLIGLGHRRIAFLRFVSYMQRDVDLDSKERSQGFLIAMDEAGLTGAGEAVFNATPRDKEGLAIKRILDAQPRFTAVVASDPTRGAAILEAARSAGRKVPQNLSIVCLQGASAPAPQLAGPRISFEEIGFRAAMKLADPAPAERHLRVHTEWREGRTIAPPG